MILLLMLEALQNFFQYNACRVQKLNIYQIGQLILGNVKLFEDSRKEVAERKKTEKNIEQLPNVYFSYSHMAYPYYNISMARTQCRHFYQPCSCFIFE